MVGDFEHDLNPVTFVTIGAEGPPGQRTFYLQAARGREVVSLIIEKFQAVSLAHGIEELFERIAEHHPERVGGLRPADGDMALLQPVAPAFRVGEMSIGIDEDDEHIVLVAEENGPDDEVRRVRIGATYEQMLALAQRALTVAQQGRPICELCGEPKEADGHFCPRKNGHARLPGD